MRSGKWRNPHVNTLTKRIDVIGVTEQTNEIGATEYIKEKIRTIWAEIIPQTGSMGDRSGTEFAKMTHKIKVRYSVGKDLKNTYTLKYNDREYEILYILNPYESNVYLEIFAREVME